MKTDKTKNKPTVSACMVVHNEEAIIERCFKSMQGVIDELIVVHDGPCEDKTLEIAKRYGAKIFVKEPPRGSAERYRAFGYAQATGDWVLFIDPDEFLTEKARQEIPTLILNPNVDAYAFNWPSWDGTKYIKGPFYWQARTVLFRREKMYYLGITHEAAKTYGTYVKRLDIMMEHQPQYNRYSFKNIRKKWFKWSDLQAHQIIHVRTAPTFNIPDDSHEIYAYYDELLAHPYFSLIRRYIINDFIKMILRRGLLAYPSPTTLKIMLIAYINVIYFAHSLSKQQKEHKRRLVDPEIEKLFEEKGEHFTYKKY